MSGVQFFQTAMGHGFYERTMPDLVRQIAGLNENLEKLIARLPATGDAAANTADAAARERDDDGAR